MRSIGIERNERTKTKELTLLIYSHDTFHVGRGQDANVQTSGRDRRRLDASPSQIRSLNWQVKSRRARLRSLILISSRRFAFRRAARKSLLKPRGDNRHVARRRIASQVYVCTFVAGSSADTRGNRYTCTRTGSRGTTVLNPRLQNPRPPFYFAPCVDRQIVAV